jgi:hypothetical protein
MKQKSKVAKPAKTTKRAQSAKTRDLPTLAASTKIRGGKLAANHVELALLR